MGPWLARQPGAGQERATGLIKARRGLAAPAAPAATKVTGAAGGELMVLDHRQVDL